jgi:hypothetical protein
MARENVTFLVNLRQNENTESKNYGQYYPEAESKEPLSLKGFARHLSEHGKQATYEMLVLQNIVSCMKELITQGQSVKLDGLGIFYPTIEGVGSDSVEEAIQAMNEKIKGVHLRFQPEGTKDEKLTSRALKELCVFEPYQLVKTKYKVIDGKKKSYQERTPLSTYGIATHTEP